MRDADYYADWCPVCGTSIWYGQGYCSQACMYKGDNWSAEQIAADQEKEKWNKRVRAATAHFESLLKDEEKEVEEMFRQHRLSEADITKEVLIELVETGYADIAVPFQTKLKKWKMIKGLRFAISAIDENGVEIDEFNIKIYTTRKTFISLGGNHGRLRAAILAAQDHKETKHFKWL